MLCGPEQTPLFIPVASLYPVADLYLMNAAVALPAMTGCLFATIRPSRPGRGPSRRTRRVQRLPMVGSSSVVQASMRTSLSAHSRSSPPGYH